MGFLLNNKLFQVSPVQGSLEEEGRSDLSTAQSKGVTTSEARLESPPRVTDVEGKNDTLHFPQESPKLLTPQTFYSENYLASTDPSKGLNNWVREKQPHCYDGPGTPPQDNFLPRDKRWSNCSLNVTSEICSKDLCFIYHYRAIIRFVNIESSVVSLTRDLITLLLSSCTHCSG